MFGKKNKQYRVRFVGLDREIQIPADENILSAALNQGLPLPHSCRVGSCGTCKSRLVEGKVRELTDSAYVLSSEELDQRYILICQSRPKSDLVLAAGESGPVTQSARIQSQTALTHDILELRLRTAAPVSYRAGQYADLHLEQIGRSRSYSFAAPPKHQTTELVFHVRHLPGGEFTDWLFAADRSGTELQLRAPLGEFYLREGDAPILCVAGGSGMAPIKALLEQAARDGVSRPVTYLFGARTKRDLYCLEEMQELTRCWAAKFRFLPVLSEEPEDSDWTGLRGLVTDQLREQCPEAGSSDAYLCGPPGMIDAAIDVLRELGLPVERIRFDRFTDARNLAALNAD
ncbi:MAG: 2Fe-2S iron-sulfur cluster binding domain-containing protein [Leptospiraceae bacterium]|nr:2Fe-2S iron-sulfur cluster binding domain-containing protein [Leptospiraceae bacterium]